MHPKTNTNGHGHKPSDEISHEQIELGRRQGEAFQDALRNMTGKEARGEQQTACDYLITWASEKAEGLYVQEGGSLMWREPQTENTHIEVAVCDAADGRFIPGLTVHATLIAANGRQIGPHQQPFLWHPCLYHYGRNWEVPGQGPYMLRIRVEAPDFIRHDKTNGKRFEQPVEVEFSDVRLELGQK